MSILKVLGWIFFPFIMIFIQWKKLGSVGKGFAIAWTVLFVLIGVIGNMGNTNDAINTTAQIENVESVANTDEKASEEVSLNVEDKEDEPPIVKKNEKDEAQIDNIPTEFKSALKKAESYAKTMHMSKSAIFDQLTSEYGEKFSEEAAQYAMDNFEYDWKANALKKAETYSRTMDMSKAGIYDQLISEHGEKFTDDEAQYAIDNVEANFKENALNKARTYQDSMAMSPEAIRDQLTSSYGEKFTKEEADYAIANLD